MKGDLYDHPVMSLHQSGVKVTIGTDDPMIQNSWLKDDLGVARVLGATEEDLRIFQENALNCAFLPEEIRAELRGKI